jgi:hypothetical protein
MVEGVVQITPAKQFALFGTSLTNYTSVVPTVLPVLVVEQAGKYRRNGIRRVAVTDLCRKPPS